MRARVYGTRPLKVEGAPLKRLYRVPSGVGPSAWRGWANRIFFFATARRMPQRKGFDRHLIIECHIGDGGEPPS